jgi:elongation factor Ts
MMSASQVKELRERTGLGLLECKKALAAANGDIDTASRSCASPAA